MKKGEQPPELGESTGTLTVREPGTAPQQDWSSTPDRSPTCPAAAGTYSQAASLLNLLLSPSAHHAIASRQIPQPRHAILLLLPLAALTASSSASGRCHRNLRFLRLNSPAPAQSKSKSKSFCSDPLRAATCAHRESPTASLSYSRRCRDENRNFREQGQAKTQREPPLALHHWTGLQLVL